MTGDGNGAGRILFYFGWLGIGFTEVVTFEQALHQAQGVSHWISGRRVFEAKEHKGLWLAVQQQRVQGA